MVTGSPSSSLQLEMFIILPTLITVLMTAYESGPGIETSNDVVQKKVKRNVHEKYANADGYLNQMGYRMSHHK